MATVEEGVEIQNNNARRHKIGTVSRDQTAKQECIRALKEFERPKKGGRMQLKESKTITLHDVSLKEIHDKLLAVLKEEEAEER